MLLLLAVLAVGCGGEETHITVDEEQVIGVWLKSGTQEYWRYKADNTGAMWDRADGFDEELPSFSFEWSVAGDRLTHVVRGEQIDVPITRTYTIKAISGTTMEREEELATYTLNRITE